MRHSDVPFLPSRLDALALPPAVVERLLQANASVRSCGDALVLFRARALEAFLESLPRRRRLSMDASGPQQGSTQGDAERERPEGVMVQQPITVSQGLDFTGPGSECRLDVLAAQDLLLRVAKAGLCGKLFQCNS